MLSTYKYKKGFFTSIKNNKEISIVINKTLFEKISKDTLNQLESISKIKEVSSPIFAMPDIHVGFGVPIGSVFATELKDAIISSEAVGYDINCGIRVLKTNLFLKDLKKEDLLRLSKEIKKLPLGLSSKGLKITDKDYKSILTKGVNWCLSNKYCRDSDVSKIYNEGYFENADVSKISKEALKRGKNQIGTLGQGNHFIDILEVSKIFNKEVAKTFGLLKGQLVIMLHSGSRGLGHQIATDYYKLFKNKAPISHAPFISKEGQDYFKAMNAAANFAFVNRAVLSHLIENKLKEIFVGRKLDFSLLYDLSHNLATIEKHNNTEYVVTRKGATKVFLPEDLDKASPYKKTGSPIILPGSMLDYSYILVPDKGVVSTFSSVAHGSGRELSRKQAKEKISFKDLKIFMENKNVILEGISENLAREEQPQAYKSSREVISSMEDAKMVKKVAQLKPVVVVLG